MKCIFRLLAVLLLTAATLISCASEHADNDNHVLSGVVNTDGSTSMADIMAVLQETFKELHPKVTVNFSGTGSGAGVESVLAGTCDIGLSSRPLKNSEAEKGALAYTVALDGIAVVVHPSNPVQDISRQQLAGIFTGHITNWSQLGGENLPIAPLGREAGSGTRSAFEDALDITDRCRYKNEYSSSGDIIGSVASNPSAIGYTSLSTADSTVSLLTVDGVSCTEDTVREGSYSIQRPFLLVISKDTPLSDQTQAFLEYALSSDAAKYISIAGAIPPQ